MDRRLGATVASLVLSAGLSSCGGGGGSSAGDPSPTTHTPTSTAAPTAADPSQSAGQEEVTALAAFRILQKPCQWLAKTPFIAAGGEQRWTARATTFTPKSPGWQKYLETWNGIIGPKAVKVSECAMAVSQERALVLLVVAMPTPEEAGAALDDDHGRNGLGDQADLGVVDNGGSGFMRVDRVFVHLSLFYDGINGVPARDIVERILGDIEPGLTPAT